jgi:glycogen debranching enzyme
VGVSVIERRHDYLIRIRPRASLIQVSQGRTVLATDLDGFVRGGADTGLFVHETRLLSRWRYLVGGVAPTPVALSSVSQHSWLGYYVTLPPGASSPSRDEGSGHVEQVSEQTLELRLSRYVGGGLHEDVDLTNFSSHPTSFLLELEVDGDFADQEELAGQRRHHGGETRTSWREADVGWELLIDHRAQRPAHDGDAGPARIHRAVEVRFRGASTPKLVGGRVRFAVDLPPGATWHACVDVIGLIEQKVLAPAYGCRSFGKTKSTIDAARDSFLQGSTSFATREDDTLAPVVVAALEQAKHDLASLRLDEAGTDVAAWTVAAGLPTYLALFGRDTLTAGWQAALLGPELMSGALEVLARYQGTVVDDWRDEQPGRHLHEAHTGPLAMLDCTPRRRYYGSATTSGFYGFVLSELWHWTGDRGHTAQLLEPAVAALRYLDERSPRSRSGFYQYQTRSRQGVVHQGWKDSRDAIVYEDGTPVAPPIATCEEQAFVYAAKLHLSEFFWSRRDKDTAKRLYREAADLKRRFNESFWLEREGFIAMGLDADERPIRSISSNPGHCVAAGIVDEELVVPVVRRLFEEDLFSGWGVRTLSALHPAYNPYSYHRGSVWPVEQGSFAMGFMRFGLRRELERLCRAQFEAARLFDFHRLPEVFGGQPRDADHPFPALYARANSPQAWSCSTLFLMLQAMLGLYPYAPLRLLIVDPVLPAWLPEISLRGLRVGDARVTLRFWRTASGATSWEVIEQVGTLHVLRQASPWSLTARVPERVVDFFSSLLPGH